MKQNYKDGTRKVGLSSLLNIKEAAFIPIIHTLQNRVVQHRKIKFIKNKRFLIKYEIEGKEEAINK